MINAYIKNLEKEEKIRVWWNENKSFLLTTLFVIFNVILFGTALFNSLFIDKDLFTLSSNKYPEDMDCFPIDSYGRYPHCEQK